MDSTTLPAIGRSFLQEKIHTIRNVQVVLDEDLAELYNVKTKRLNEQVSRNKERFPPEFMFQLTELEFQHLMSQFATSSWGGRRTLPYAFTEQGVAMLSGVLKSETAIRTSIAIMNAFVAMRRFLSLNGHIFQRLSAVEVKQLDHDKKFDELFDAIQDKDFKPSQGIFFDGQVFDAYKFISDIIRSANESIILIDNYVDDSVLVLLNKRKKRVTATIYTKEVNQELLLDIKKHNTQYPPINVKEFQQSHDRFLIIDCNNVYHFGASLKDVGKKWFAFSTFDKESFTLLEKLGILTEKKQNKKGSNQ